MFNSYSFKASAETVLKIQNFYKEWKKENVNDNIIFFASYDTFKVTIFTNNTVLFQGKDAFNEYLIFNPIQEEKEHIGSDEVGCGDFFGPIVVCSAYINNELATKIYELGIKDSKQLSDEKILQIAPILKKTIPYCVFTLTNQKYNEIQKKNYNLNKIKAYLHNFVLTKLIDKTKFNELVVVDQFCKEDLYYAYLSDYKDKVFNKITFEEKAENKYLAVACASIIARETFLSYIKELENKINHTIFLGANSKVDDLAYTLAKEIGIENMNNYVKVHFKNYKTLIERLDKQNA